MATSTGSSSRQRRRQQQPRLRLAALTSLLLLGVCGLSTLASAFFVAPPSSTMLQLPHHHRGYVSAEVWRGLFIMDRYPKPPTPVLTLPPCHHPSILCRPMATRPRQVRSKGLAVAMMDQITSGLIGALKGITGQKTISEANIDGALR